MATTYLKYSIKGTSVLPALIGATITTKATGKWRLYSPVIAEPGMFYILPEYNYPGSYLGTATGSMVDDKDKKSLCEVTVMGNVYYVIDGVKKTVPTGMKIWVDAYGVDAKLVGASATTTIPTIPDAPVTPPSDENKTPWGWIIGGIALLAGIGTIIYYVFFNKSTKMRPQLAGHKKKSNLGNPMLLAAAASNPDITKAATQIVVKTQERAFSLMKWIGIALLSAGAIYGGSLIWKKIRLNSWRNKAATDDNIQAAISIYEAIPAGLKEGEGSLFHPFAFISDLVNKIALLWTPSASAAIYNISKSITNIKTTATAFKIFYKEDLYDLLHKALTQSEYDLFMSSAKAIKAFVSDKASDTSILNKRVITKNETSGRYVWMDGWKMYYKDMTVPIPAGTYVGRATGKVKAYNQESATIHKNTDYWEMMITKSKTYYLYLPKKDLKTISDDGFSAADYNPTFLLK